VSGGELKENAKKEIGGSFERLHESRYGHRIEAPLTTTNARLKAIGRIKDLPVAEIGRGDKAADGAMKSKRKVYLDGAFVDARI
jgi:N-methylhydantoinase A/oxoprolinase/acetone carboxylase beta subunit